MGTGEADGLKKRKIVATGLDGQIEELADRADHKTLAVWAADCAERVLPYFEQERPRDDRPRKAIEHLRKWVRTGEFHMAEVRGASLAAHAAAREVPEGNAAAAAAHSAARAAGQAVATAHVPRHALGAGLYAATAVRDAAPPGEAESATLKERGWQYRHLMELMRDSPVAKEDST